MKWGDRQGKAQRWEPRSEAQARGAGDLSSGPGRGSRAGGLPMQTTDLGGGPGGRPGRPMGLTWRLCSAASSSRCRFAQTSRCSGKVGPGPAMLGLSASSRAGRRARRGRPGSASASGLARALRLPSAPSRSSAHRSPRAPAAVAAAAASQAEGRAGSAGSAGGAAPRRGGASGLARPCFAAAETSARPALAGGGRGVLPSSPGDHVRQGRSQDLRLSPGLSREGSAEGVPEGGAWMQLRQRPAGGVSDTAQTHPGGSGRGRRESGDWAVRRGAGPGSPGRERECARACSAARGPVALGVRAFPRQFLACDPVFLPRPRGYRPGLCVRVGCEVRACLPITSEMPLNADQLSLKHLSQGPGPVYAAGTPQAGPCPGVGGALESGMGVRGGGGAGLASSRSSGGLFTVSGCFHPSRTSLLQRLHFAASVRRGRRVSKSGPTPPPTPEPGCRPPPLVELRCPYPGLSLGFGEAVARLGQG